MLRDRYGNAVSTASHAALRHYDEALLSIRLYQDDPIAMLDGALTEDPGFTMAWAARAAVLVQQADGAYLGEVRRSLANGAAGKGNDAERAHLSAAADWAAGKVDRGVAGFARIARENPRDLLALQTAHIGHFYRGRASDLRDGPLQALRGFGPGDDGRHAVLGMAAFGLEECGDYARAEATGSEAAEGEPRDAWAVHAVAHVHEMRGDADRGIAWLLGSTEAMSPRSGFAFHNWWHLALFHLDRDDQVAALAVYDQRVRPVANADVLLEWIDASALLWRLYLEGVDTGDRFNRLADCWMRAIDDGIDPFNDLHALMAFIGAGRTADADRCIRCLRRTAAGSGEHADSVRNVALPLADAFIAFSDRRFSDAAESILAIRGVAHRIGGSHAQRDILSLTALAAARQGGMRGVASALIAERLAHKPASRWAHRLSESLSSME